MPLIRALTVAAFFATAFTFASPAFADDFYEQQLQIAKIDFAAGRTVQAADELRIAAFGFLDRPPLLTEALARLALAQSTLGQTSLVKQTLNRFVDVEQRFATYPSLPLDAATRAKFEALLTSTISAETLKSIPSLAKLVRTPFEAAGDLPLSQRIAAYEAGFRREPNNVQWPLALMRFYASSGEQGDVVRWAQGVLGLDPRNAEARALLVHAHASRGECREALNVFAGFTAAELQSRPDAYADQGVCLAETGKTAEAKAAFAKTSDAARSRSDVKKAMQRIADRDAAASAATKPASSPASAKPAPELTAKGGPQTAATTPAGASSRQSGAASSSVAATQPKPASAYAVLSSTHALLQSGKYRDALRELRIAVQSDPANRELRLAMLEAAVLSKEWRIAGAQVAATSPYSAGEELYMFYASVALYENGRLEDAKPLMERSRARMVPSPMVDYYIKVILADNPNG